ncbi:diguanylate cyclase [Synechococcus sp. CCY9201]|uniref:sensor domain-containing diguanylate cyclase n=1 Tax=unclassified Synechococcus TaxID=2626047 RepID=UPI0018CF2CE0|nr:MULTISPECIES: diguanylate cyclase [unclassified Synechococcus]MEA5422748.1 diguanylate cyclase [Synechococcus sp. CCY9202]MEA5474159.1 diguanylate cyclase [Synechococcus sp. CCY9201]QPN66660.1 diguanylate cyclase [Synechococcus sp. CBW1006]
MTAQLGPANAARIIQVDVDQPYRAIVEQMGHGVLTLSSSGAVHYANQALADLIGHARETLCGQPFTALTPSSQWPTVDRLRQVSPGRTEQAELVLLHRNGEPVLTLMSSSGLRNGDLETQCLVATDLSGLAPVHLDRGSETYRHRLLTEALSAFLVEIDADRCIRWITPSVRSLLGWTSHQLLGGSLAELLPDVDLLPDFNPAQAFALCPDQQSVLRLRASDGTDRWMRCLCWPLAGEGRACCGWILAFQDGAAAERINGDSSHRRAPQGEAGIGSDRLTGLMNRTALVQRLSQLDHSRWRRCQPVGLACWDLDAFRLLNQSYGREAGDQVLRSLADRLRRLVLPSDLMARLGGDQLVAVFAGMGSLEEVVQLAESIRRVLALPLPVSGHWIRPRLSVGVTLEQPGDCPEDLLSRTCRALRQAKSQGGNRGFPVAVPPLQAAHPDLASCC